MKESGILGRQFKTGGFCYSSDGRSLRRYALLVATVLASLCFWGCASRQKVAQKDMPNIILVLCDNLGYGDLKVYNPNAKQSTPRISQLASEGMVFHHAYAAAAAMKPASCAHTSGSIRTRSSGRTPTCSLSQFGSMVMSPSSDSAILSNTDRISKCSGVPS